MSPPEIDIATIVDRPGEIPAPRAVTAEARRAELEAERRPEKQERDSSRNQQRGDEAVVETDGRDVEEEGDLGQGAGAPPDEPVLAMSTVMFPAM